MVLACWRKLTSKTSKWEKLQWSEAAADGAINTRCMNLKVFYKVIYFLKKEKG